MAQTETKVITAQIPLSLSNAIDEIAARANCSHDLIVAEALMDWIYSQESDRARLIRKALDDVAAGRVVDHEAVRAWAESLGTDSPLPLPVSRR